MQVVDRNGRLKVEITSTVDDLSVGVTTISGGTNGRVLYDNAGILGEIAGTSSQFIKGNGSLDSNTYLTSAVTSVGLSMPSAFSVANSPITTSGTIAVTGAGVTSQYIRGDGSLANFPTSTGGGASVSYYLNGSVSQGTIGGVAYKEINGVPVIGAGTDFSINADGYIAQFITDVGDPNKLLIPAGNWNFETYFSASSSGGSPQFYIELYKYNGTTFTLIASNSATPENITGGTAIDLYFTALAVPATTLLATDRIAVRFYVIHSGRTITMHTENSHLSQIITTFSTGLTALNGLSSQVQYLATGTSGTNFNISSVTDTHTFNLPTASATNRGALSSADWTTFNNKVPTTRTLTINGTTQDLSADRTFTISTGITIGTTAITSGTVGRVLFQGTGSVVSQSTNLFWDLTNNRLGIGTSSPAYPLDVNGMGRVQGQFITGGGTPLALTGESFAFQTVVASGAGGSVFGTNGSNPSFIDILSNNNFWHISNRSLGNNDRLGIYNASFTGSTATYTSELFTFHKTGNFSINTITDAGFKLDVNGTARVSDNLLLTNGIIATSTATTRLQSSLNFFTHNRLTSSGALGFKIAVAGTDVAFWRRDDGSGDVEFGNATDNGIAFYGNNLSRAKMWRTGQWIFGNGTTYVASALVAMESTTTGFLPPRMTTTQKNAIATPATGLMVYDTTLNVITYYNGTTWI